MTRITQPPEPSSAESDQDSTLSLREKSTKFRRGIKRVSAIDPDKFTKDKRKQFSRFSKDGKGNSLITELLRAAIRNTGSGKPTKPASLPETKNGTKPSQTFVPAAKDNSDTNPDLPEGNNPGEATPKASTQKSDLSKPALPPKPKNDAPRKSFGKHTTKTVGEPNAPIVTVRRNVIQNTVSTPASLPGDQNGTKPSQPFILAAKANTDTSSKPKQASTTPRKSVGKPNALFVAVRRNITQTTVPTKPASQAGDQTDTKPLAAHILAAKAETGSESKPASNTPRESVGEPTSGTEQTAETIGESDTPFVAVRRNVTQTKVPTKPAAKAKTGSESKPASNTPSESVGEPTSGTEQTAETIGESDTPFVAVRRNATQTKVPTKPAAKAKTGSESKPASNTPRESVGESTNGTEQTAETIGESDTPFVAVRRNVTQTKVPTKPAAKAKTGSESKPTSNTPRESVGETTSGTEQTAETIGESDTPFVAVRRNVTQAKAPTKPATKAKTGSESKPASNTPSESVGETTSGTEQTAETIGESDTPFVAVRRNGTQAKVPTRPADQTDTKPLPAHILAAKA
ncbi:MAG: hypothetical protein P8X79_10645, partial [Reinekea sp.]